MRELDEIFGPDAERDFWLKLDDLAHDICDLLKLVPPPPDPIATRGCVYLAVTTAELKESREEIRARPRTARVHGASRSSAAARRR